MFTFFPLPSSYFFSFPSSHRSTDIDLLDSDRLLSPQADRMASPAKKPIKLVLDAK
jgi:hypothetical protein